MREHVCRAMRKLGYCEHFTIDSEICAMLPAGTESTHAFKVLMGDKEVLRFLQFAKHGRPYHGNRFFGVYFYKGKMFFLSKRKGDMLESLSRCREWDVMMVLCVPSSNSKPVQVHYVERA